MGETQDKIDQLLREFESKDLNEKLSFLYAEYLNSRYSLQLDHEWHVENNPMDDFDYEQAEQDHRDMRIEALEFTDKEILFLSWAAGMWDGMARSRISLRLGMTILALICDKRSPQVYQNIISRTKKKGAIDKDWMLNTSQEAELFAKLNKLDDPSRINPLVTYLNEWLMARRRTL